MKKLFILLILVSINKNSEAGTWCKAVYPYKEGQFYENEFQKQLQICKNNDNLFISISKKYTNASHLINAAIANYCDLNRQVLKSEPHNENDSFFSAVCVFRKHYLREN